MSRSSGREAVDDTTGSIRSNGWAPPSASHLRRGLESVFGDQGLKSVVRREANPNEAYYPSEVLTCRFHTGPERRLLLKYAPDPNEMYGGHLTGPENEQLVYDHVLTRPRCSVPAFYGCYRDPLTNALWSVAEYIEGGECLGRMHPQARWMGLAARWVGAFHATGQDSDSPGERPPLQRYDAPFYRQWAVSTAAFEGDRRAWLTELVGRYDRVVERLLAQPQVVVHGDYFWDNIVVREGTVFPVGLGAGGGWGWGDRPRHVDRRVGNSARRRRRLPAGVSGRALVRGGVEGLRAHAGQRAAPCAVHAAWRGRDATES